MADHTRERSVAVAAVREACRLSLAVQERLISAETLAKKDRSPVTVADLGTQALISLLLTDGGCTDPLVAEEGLDAFEGPAGAVLRERVIAQVIARRPQASEATVLQAIARGAHTGGAQGRFWTLDPIDGTKGFLRREQYAIALALIEDGQLVLGVLGCPNLPAAWDDPQAQRGSLFVAERGRGAVTLSLEGGEERPIRVAEIADPRQAVFCESVESGHSSHGDAAQIAARLGVTAPPLRLDSQCKYATVARGDVSIYLRLPTQADYQEKIWDHAAGALVVQEAGGKVTDVRGKALDFSVGRTLRNNAGAVATNGRLHEQVLAAVSAQLDAARPT